MPLLVVASLATGCGPGSRSGAGDLEDLRGSPDPAIAAAPACTPEVCDDVRIESTATLTVTSAAMGPHGGVWLAGPTAGTIAVGDLSLTDPGAWFLHVDDALVPDLLFARNFTVAEVAPTADGGLLVLAQSPTGDPDVAALVDPGVPYALVRLDAAGGVLWAHGMTSLGYQGGGAGVLVVGFVERADGDVVVAGWAGNVDSFAGQDLIPADVTAGGSFLGLLDGATGDMLSHVMLGSVNLAGLALGADEVPVLVGSFYAGTFAGEALPATSTAGALVAAVTLEGVARWTHLMSVPEPPSVGGCAGERVRARADGTVAVLGDCVLAPQHELPEDLDDRLADGFSTPWTTAYAVDGALLGGGVLDAPGTVGSGSGGLVAGPEGYLYGSFGNTGLHIAQPRGFAFSNSRPPTLRGPIAGDGSDLVTIHRSQGADHEYWGTYPLTRSEPPANTTTWLVRLPLPR